MITRGSTPVLIRYYLGDCMEVDIDSLGVVKKKLYLGGDYYSAPMVTIRTGNSSWIPYNIVRNYQGSIMKILPGDSYYAVQSYSYDPWGRMADTYTLEPYAPGNEPTLFLGRGYCGHEHLPWFGLINMNARLYDPAIGRFLSPDPYVQDATCTQHFNRYSYAMNNPLKYTDPSGEVIWEAALISALIFGAGNLLSHAIRNEDLGHGAWAKYFFSGAAVGAGLVGIYAGAGALAGLGSPFLSALGVGTRTLMLSAGMSVFYSTGVNFAASAINGLVSKNDQWFNNFGKTLLGNFYLDENKSFFAQIYEGISRFTWEAPQQALGYLVSSIRNGWANRVDLWGGATFTSRLGRTTSWGMTLGSYINVDSSDTNTVIDSKGGFNGYMMDSKNPMVNSLYAHEYGHTIQSKIWGPAYLVTPALMSLCNCIPGTFTTSHKYYWTESSGCAYARDYFRSHFPSFNWNYTDCPVEYFINSLL